MPIFDNFEKKFLFGLTRIFAMLIILGILISIGLGSIKFANLSKGVNTKVTASEVINEIKPPDDTSSNRSVSPTQLTDRSNVLPSIKIPFILQKHFNDPENVKLLNGWLNIVPADTRQSFIDEMAAAVTEAEKIKLSATDAIYKYKELKFKRLGEENSEKNNRQTQQLYFAGAVFGAVALIALFSLILVLLAIERNTRRTEQ